jgi:hypothetical protein
MVSDYHSWSLLALSARPQRHRSALWSQGRAAIIVEKCCASCTGFGAPWLARPYAQG